MQFVPFDNLAIIRKGDFIMKKIISIVLCLALVFSVCSFSMTTNAASVNKSVSVAYVFNDNSLYVSLGANLENYKVTYVRVTITTDTEMLSDPNFRKKVPKVYVSGTLSVEEVFEEYIPNCDLLERIDECCGENTFNYSEKYTVSQLLSEKINYIEMFTNDSNIDENDIRDIILNLNPTNLGELFIQNDLVESLTPIVDGLLSTCKNTLTLFEFFGSALNMVDNRLFTEFPKIVSGNMLLIGGRIWHFNDSITHIYDDYYYYVISQNEYTELLNKNPDAMKQRLQSCFEEVLLPNIVVPENVSYSASFGYHNASVYFNYTYNNKSAELCTLRLKYVVQADPTQDNVVDAFDVAMTTECVNTFEEPEESAVMVAMDVVADGYIDATDLAYISYIANFEE